MLSFANQYPDLFDEMALFPVSSKLIKLQDSRLYNSHISPTMHSVSACIVEDVICNDVSMHVDDNTCMHTTSTNHECTDYSNSRVSNNSHGMGVLLNGKVRLVLRGSRSFLNNTFGGHQRTCCTNVLATPSNIDQIFGPGSSAYSCSAARNSRPLAIVQIKEKSQSLPDAQMTCDPFSITVQTENGCHRTFNSEVEYQKYVETLNNTYTRFTVLTEPITGLCGGGRRKGGRRRKKKNRRGAGGSSLNYGKQLGQINRVARLDAPITTTLRFNASLITDGVGVLAARFSLRNPLRAFNGSGAYVNAVDYGALYDQYKVTAFCFQFEPAPNGPPKGGVVIAYDYDSNDTTTPNYANIVNYGAYRIFNVGQQFETATKLPVLTSAFDTSTDPPTAITVHRGGWIDAATPAVCGNMFIGGTNLGNSITLGTFVLTLRVRWRFRR